MGAIRFCVCFFFIFSSFACWAMRDKEPPVLAKLSPTAKKMRNNFLPSTQMRRQIVADSKKVETTIHYIDTNIFWAIPLKAKKRLAQESICFSFKANTTLPKKKCIDVLAAYLYTKGKYPLLEQCTEEAKNHCTTLKDKPGIRNGEALKAMWLLVHGKNIVQEFNEIIFTENGIPVTSDTASIPPKKNKKKKKGFLSFWTN